MPTPRVRPEISISRRSRRWTRSTAGSRGFSSVSSNGSAMEAAGTIKMSDCQAAELQRTEMRSSMAPSGTGAARSMRGAGAVVPSPARRRSMRRGGTARRRIAATAIRVLATSLSGAEAAVDVDDEIDEKNVPGIDLQGMPAEQLKKSEREQGAKERGQPTARSASPRRDRR